MKERYNISFRLVYCCRPGTMRRMITNYQVGQQVNYIQLNFCSLLNFPSQDSGQSSLYYIRQCYVDGQAPMLKVSDFVLKLTKNCIIVWEKAGGEASTQRLAVKIAGININSNQFQIIIDGIITKLIVKTLLQKTHDNNYKGV